MCFLCFTCSLKGNPYKPKNISTIKASPFSPGKQQNKKNSLQQKHSMAGKRIVLQALLEMVDSLPDDAPVVGPLSSSGIRMPKSSSDGRALTWTKFVGTLSGKILNDPQDVHDCWFVAASKDNGYHQSKLSATGANNKQQTHRILFLLRNPTKSLDTGLHVSHDCGNGCGRGTLRCCINPLHLSLRTVAENQSQKGCTYGCFQLCPHNPKCIFMWADTGAPKVCLNQPLLPATCDCVRKCF